MKELLYLVFVLLLVGGIWLLRQAARQRQKVGLPQGRVIYADTGAWVRVERPLFSRRYQLTGRPDYLLDSGGEIVPVEVKASPAPAQPYPSHLLQLAAYGLLVQEHYHIRPSYGIIHYRDRTFAVDLAPELEDWLLNTLENIRNDATLDDVPRSHDNPAQCASCGYHPFCDESLA